jgi:hypothetical protein
MVKGVQTLADQYIALIIGLLVFLGSLISVETGISVALIEITLGVIGGIALSTTSLAVVYAVLVETGLTNGVVLHTKVLPRT